VLVNIGGIVEFVVAICLKEAYRWLSFFQLQPRPSAPETLSRSLSFIQPINLHPILIIDSFHYQLRYAFAYLNLVI